MANNKYTVMELEAIKKLCKSVNLIANLPTDLIADTNVATNTTYSSYRIDAEMNALENDIQTYFHNYKLGRLYSFYNLPISNLTHLSQHFLQSVHFM